MPSNIRLIIITVEIDDSGEWSRYDIDSKLPLPMQAGVFRDALNMTIAKMEVVECGD